MLNRYYRNQRGRKSLLGPSKCPVKNEPLPLTRLLIEQRRKLQSTKSLINLNRILTISKISIHTSPDTQSAQPNLSSESSFNNIVDSIDSPKFPFSKQLISRSNQRDPRDDLLSPRQCSDMPPIGRCTAAKVKECLLNTRSD